MSCFYRGTGGCSQLYSPYCGALENDCQFCGPRSMGASCANWNGQALFGNSCCAKRLRLATESTLLKRKSFSKRIAEEEAKDALKNKKNKKGRKNSQDLEIMFKALENYCDPKKCENCRNGCGKCGKEDGTKADQKRSATNIKSCSSKTSRVLPSELANTKKPDENQEEANKEKTKPETKKQLGSTPDTREKSSALANAAKPGKYENPITTKPSENKEASKVTPQSKRQLENSEASKTSKQLKPEATKDDMERRQFNELEICNILTDLLVKKFKAIDYNNKKLSTKKYTPSTSLCCSQCTCEVCSCLGSTDFSEVESKIGTAIGSLLNENQSKGKNVAQKNSAQKENDTKKLKTPKETLPIGMSPMAAINPRRAKERTDQKIFVDASTSMSDSNDDVKTMMVKKVPNSSPIDKLINELNEIEEEEAKCCKTSSKGYWSEIDDDLSDPVLKKKKKVKGAKKLSTKGARKGSLASKRSSTESKVDKKRKSSSNCVCKASDKGSPAELTRGSRLKEGCNINTCMSKECSARKLRKPMIEILTYASNLNVERSNKSSRAGSPDRDTKESTAQDLSKRKCSRASQTLSLIESVQESFDSRSSSRGSTSTSQIEEHESHNARLPSTKIRSPDIVPIGKSPEKKPSISAPDIRASVSSAEKRQSKTSDKRQSVTSPDSRKLTTSPDSRKATTSPDTRKPNTSPDSRKSNTSPDSRKPVTSPDSRKPTTSPDSRQPDRKPNTSPDSRKPATSPDSRKPATSPESRKPTISPVNMNCCNMNSCTSKECPPKNRSLRAESSRMESVQKCCDSRSSSRGSTSTSQIEEHESHSVRPLSTKTRSPNIIPSVKSPDKKTSTSAPDIKASGSSATKRQSKPVDKMKSATSPDSRKPTTSPDSRKPTTSPDSRKPTTSPDSRQPIISLDIRPSTPSDKKQSPDNKPSIRFPDKNQTISSDKRQFITSPDEMLSNGRQEEGCTNSCSRKEGPAKNFNKSPQEESPTTVPKESTPKDLPARKCTIASQTEPTNELFEKDRNAIPRKKETAPIKASSSSEAKSSDYIPSVRTPDKKLTRRSPTKKSSIRSAKTSSVRSPDKKPSVRSSDKKPSIRSSAKKQSSPRQREGCCMQTCTSKECRIKKSSQVESFAKETTPKNLTRGKSARSPPTVSQDESLQKDRNSRRTPTASSSVTPVKNASPGHNMRSTGNKTTVRSSDKKIAISTSGKTTTVRASNKKLAKSSPVNKRSNTSPENSYSSSSPHILSSSSRPDEDLIIRTNSSAKNDFAKKYSCECRTSAQSKTYAEESNESTEDDASNENPTIECSIQKRTVYSQTVVLNESSLEDTDSSNVPGESKIANDSRIPAENTRGDNFSRNNSCQCDTDETDESSIKPFDMSQQMDVKPSAKSALKANFNEKSPTAGSRQSKTKMMCKSLSEKDVSLREEEMRMADFSANESCACDLQKEEDPMKSPVFDRCLCDSYPTNFHPCRTEGNRCPCNDERKSGSVYIAGDSKNTTRRSSDKGQTENKSEAYSSRKKSPNPDERTPTENGANTYSGQNNCGCQCINKAPNLMETSPHGSKPNLFAFINTKTDDLNMSDANAKNLEVKKQSATPDDCTFPAQRDERRAECNQALAAFRKLQECFSDFDLEGECFKKLENYAEFHSDIFGPSCLCDQNLNSNSDDKKRNSKALRPDEKENERSESKNKQNKSKERTK